MIKFITKTVLFDIDGTLADINHRRHHVEGGRKDWRAFNAGMGEDVPNQPVVDLYHAIWASGVFDVILVTGRNERFREVTEQWLAWNEIPFKRLIMRPDKDSRPDHIIKKKILRQLQDEGKVIHFVVDDRQQVVNMWRANGITCLQCDEGNF